MLLFLISLSFNSSSPSSCLCLFLPYNIMCTFLPCNFSIPSPFIPFFPSPHCNLFHSFYILLHHYSHLSPLTTHITGGVFQHRDRTQEDSREVEAAKYDLNYIGLTGTYAYMCTYVYGLYSVVLPKLISSPLSLICVYLSPLIPTHLSYLMLQLTFTMLCHTPTLLSILPSFTLTHLSSLLCSPIHAVLSMLSFTVLR